MPKFSFAVLAIAIGALTACGPQTQEPERVDLTYDPTEDQEIADSEVMNDSEIEALLALSGSAAGDKIIKAGLKYQGKPYLFGAQPRTRTDKFDCSSFVYRAIRNAGYGRVPASSKTMMAHFAKKANAKRIDKSKAARGDILFLKWGRSGVAAGQPDHVAIYLGNDKVLDATRSLGVKAHSRAARYEDSRLLRVYRITGFVGK